MQLVVLGEHKGYLSPSHSPLPSPLLLLSCSSSHPCLCVCVCVHSLRAECQLQVWKTGAASWAFHTDQHLHTPHKPGMWKTDRQTDRHPLSQTLGVFMWNPIKIVPAVRLSSLQVPTPIITKLLFFSSTES